MEPPEPERLAELQRFAARMGIAGADQDPIDWQLLHQALVHPSYAAEAKLTYNNDRLEFLGDEVLRFLAAEHLYREYPDLAVGELSAVRSVLVSDRVLAGWAEEYDLGQTLRIGRTHRQSNQIEARCLADALEAVIGALYLATGTMELIIPWLLPRLRALGVEILADPVHRNYKSALQELTQQRFSQLPEYRLLNAGPPFSYEVRVQGECVGKGEGASKKSAQQAAARVAFEAIGAEGAEAG